ncbi:hypothetical protein [Nocardia carnea]|uniref:hypothetical protein n=1 Tax=Nocardia carnea TaxID=37328 RepID=UPI0024587F83|nr:hypothetical protein [Nocardia carnea]
MTPEQIRAEAIEVIARAEYEHLHFTDGYRWESTTEFNRQAYRESVARHVDALAASGLLPTAHVETRGGIEVQDAAGEIVQRIPEEHRYFTDWREAPQ